jgi:hypothetical protein
MTRIFDRLPVMIVAYSGGYLATAWAVHHGGANDRMKGVVLLDALYGELDKFERFIAGNRKAFFVSAYLGSTRARNLEMQQTLNGRTCRWRRNSASASSRAASSSCRAARRQSHGLRQPRLGRQSG